MPYFYRARTAGLLALLSCASFAQPSSSTLLVNADFEQGDLGQLPAGWAPWGGAQADDRTKARATLSDDHPAQGRRCALIANDIPIRATSLAQSLDATTLRGKRVRFRAAVRADVPEGSAARLYLRAELESGDDGGPISTSIDNMPDRPITAPTWSKYEIIANIDPSAVKVFVACVLEGAGRAWFDDASFEVLGEARAEPAVKFPSPPDTERTPGGPMPAAEAAAAMKLPPGFRCTVFAAEPDVRQPIAMATDARGRLWVAENYSYPYEGKLRDRIVILEDTDNDGVFDRRTVFWDGAQHLTSIEVGFGGVWALCLPNLVFIPDRNGDDVPDGPIEVMLDGFDFSGHNFANGLRWGPDGWLYGRHGILHTDRIGPPGTPPAERTLIGAGIWRYHPQRRTVEVVADGTTNPWGMDWDARGEPFFINTVIGHLWHLIPGAHYRRMYGDDRNPHVYELIDQHADHLHWATGEVWQDAKKGLSDATSNAGGGHAHTGLLIYQGGQWPAEWNGKLLTVNYHGRRLNTERLERSGSGFVGRHEADGFFFADTWFRGIDVIAAPDGGVFVSDWSDAGECHDYDGVHRSSGRIFKLSYGEPKPRVEGDLARRDNAGLVALQLSPNDWLARQSRRVLADRAVAGGNLADAHGALRRILKTDADVVHRLRALWALHVSGGVTRRELVDLLADSDESVCAWAIRLLTDLREAPFGDAERDACIRLGTTTPSALVRLALASALQRMRLSDRAPVAAALLRHAEDANDHNLPLMLWYGIEPLVDGPNGELEKLVASARVPLVQRLGTRRLAEEIERAPARIDPVLSGLPGDSPERCLAVLDGLAQGLSGRRKAPKPPTWDAFAARLAGDSREAIRSRVRELNAVFGDGRALAEIRALALDPAANVTERRGALRMLAEVGAPESRGVFEELLHVRELTVAAAGGLAQYDDPGIADRLLAELAKASSPERAGIMSVLVSRPAWVAKVLDRMAAGKLSRSHLSAFHARAIAALPDPTLAPRLEKIWGPVPSENVTERAATVTKWRARFTPDVMAGADTAKGRTLFRSICAACHTLNGEGGAIGPDLTGAQRDNLDYVLENVLFPSAVVPDAYRLTTLRLKDGRVMAGIVRERSATALKLQTMTELNVVAVENIAGEEVSRQSLMPPGLLDALDAAQARDLIAYIMAKGP